MDSTTAILATLTSLAVTVVGFVITWLKDGRARKWIKEDREQAARERELAIRETARVEHELKSRLESEAKERVLAHADIKKDILENTQVNTAALNAANGTNEKLLRMAESVAVVPQVAAAAAVAAVQHQPPSKVEVVNSADDPVHVTSNSDTKKIA